MMWMNAGKLEKWATSLKSNTYALYLASKDERVSVMIKFLIGLLVAYALSPIDLIPDFIPIIGYLDDLIILPIGIWLILRLIPDNVWEECLQIAKTQPITLSKNWRAATIILLIWVIILSLFALWMWNIFQTGENF